MLTERTECHNSHSKPCEGSLLIDQDSSVFSQLPGKVSQMSWTPSSSEESTLTASHPEAYSPAEKVLVYQVRILFPEWTWSERADFFNFCLPSHRPRRTIAGLAMAWTRMKRDRALMVNVSRLPQIFSVYCARFPPHSTADQCDRSSSCITTSKTGAISSLRIQVR